MAQAKSLKRRLYAADINLTIVAQSVTVYGWVSNKRELGGLTFIDLRDRSGLVQIVINESFAAAELVKKIGREYVVAVHGRVVKRAKPNPDLASGQVEIVAAEIEILAQSELPPFFPDQRGDVSEELRFKYRYLDLRGQAMQQNFQLRSRVVDAVRSRLRQQGFTEVETPILSKATPEGARDYLVPSRIYPGRVFALPQSPQLFKQLLMVSGFERYYQIARCFRDEDLRADRQPEFTQIDVEMSFAEPDELFALVESMMADVFQVRGIPVTTPFPRMTYRQAMNDYGSDQPDLRNPLVIRDFSSAVTGLRSNLLADVLASNGAIKGVVVPDGSGYSRKNLDELDESIRQLGGKGAIWLRKSEGVFKSSLKVDAADIEQFFRSHGIGDQSVVLLVGDLPARATFLAGKLRDLAGARYLDENRREFLWITDFPLFFFNEEEKRLDSNHHPFTAPRAEDVAKLESEPLAATAVAYDLVLNGVEIGGGSRRIHDIELQRRIFRLLKLDEAEIEEKFGFFLNALKYGAPPHLGIALGLDRLLMLLLGLSSIRDIIAFPKTTSSLCLLTGSPSAASKQQLQDLGISFKK